MPGGPVDPVIPPGTPECDLRTQYTYQDNMTNEGSPDAVQTVSTAYAVAQTSTLQRVYGWRHFSTPLTVGFHTSFRARVGIITSTLPSSLSYDFTHTVYFMTTNWNPATLTWNTMPSFTGMPFWVFSGKLHWETTGGKFPITYNAEGYHGVTFQPVTGTFYGIGWTFVISPAVAHSNSAYTDNLRSWTEQFFSPNV